MLGVPQGSVLSCLLFILYLNDVVFVLVHCMISIFADDKLLWVTGDTLEECVTKINEDLDRLKHWLDFNKLSLNVNKTKAMIITRKKNINKIENPVLIAGEKLEFVENFKYLGVWLDEKLNFNQHVRQLSNKINAKFYTLKTISGKLNRATKCLIYTAIVQPNIDFCSSILLSLNESQFATLQKIQNRFMRLILHAKWDTHIKDMLTKLNWMSIKQRVVFNTMKFLYKIEHEELPEYLKCQLTKKKEKTNYNLRRRSEYLVPNFLNQSQQASLFYKGLQIYNDFKFKNQPKNKSDFDRKLKIYVKENY